MDSLLHYIIENASFYRSPYSSYTDHRILKFLASSPSFWVFVLRPFSLGLKVQHTLFFTATLLSDDKLELPTIYEILRNGLSISTRGLGSVEGSGAVEVL